MSEKGMDRRDRRRIRDLKGLGELLPHAPAQSPEGPPLPDVSQSHSPERPRRARSLSSAATEEGASPETPSIQPAEKETEAPLEATSTNEAVDTAMTSPEGASDALAIEERPEWADLVKHKESGIVNGKRFWIAPDGGTYVDSGGSVPSRFGHGGKYVFTGKESGLSETLYWNAEKGDFTPSDPMPDLRRKSSKKEKQKKASDYDESGLRHSQDDLRARVAEKHMSDEARARFEQNIQTMKTRADRRALMELLKTLPAKDDTPSNKSEEIKKALEPVSPPATVRDTYQEDAFDTQGQEFDELKERLTRRKGRKYDPLLDGPKKGLSIGQSPEPNQSDAGGGGGNGNGGGGAGGGREGSPQQSQGPGWHDPNLIHAGGHERPRSWKIDSTKYIGVSPMRIPQILGSAKDAQLFGELLRAVDSSKGDVLLRFHEGSLTADDMDFLTYGAFEYSKWKKEGEAVAAQITPADIELMSRRNTDMRNFTTFLPIGRETEMMKELVLHLAMRNPAQLEDMRDALKDLKRARETSRFSRAEAQVKEQCERLGIEQKDYGAMFNLKNETQRRRTEQRLAKHIHEEAGKFRRALDWVQEITHSPLPIPGSSRYKAVLETMEASRITPNRKSILSPRSWVLSTIDTRLHTITEHLAATVADPEVRSAIAKEALTNQKAERETMGGAKNYAEVQNLAKEGYSEKSLKEKIEKHIESIPNFKSLPEPEQDAALSSFRSSERDKQKGRGFFAWLAEILFGSNFDKAARSVTGRPAHA